MTGPLGTNSIFAASYLTLGDSSAGTINTDLAIQSGEPFPAGWEPDVDRPAWWKFKVDATQWVQLDTQSSTSTVSVDTLLVVWWFNPATATYDQLYLDDDAGTGASSKIQFRAGAGATYYVEVLAWTGTGNTTYVLSASSTIPTFTGFKYNSLPSPGIGSDSFAGAIPIDLGAQVSAAWTFTGLSVEAGEPNFFSTAVAETKSCWWTFTPETTGMVQFFYSNGHAAIFTGTTLADLVLVENEYRYNEMYAMVQAGTKYYVRWANGQSTFPWLVPGSTTYLQISEVLPVIETVVPFTGVATQTAGAGYSATLTGGSGALADGSDSTYLVQGRPSNGYAGYKATAQWAAYGGPAPIVLLKQYWRASLDISPTFGEEGPCPYYYNGLNTIYTYGSRQWLWKPSELLLRTGWISTNILPIAMISGGSSNTTRAPNGWGAGADNLDIGLSWWGPQSPAGNATITEAGWLFYAWDYDGGPTQPPDQILELSGQLDSTRIRPYIRRRRR